MAQAGTTEITKPDHSDLTTLDLDEDEKYKEPSEMNEETKEDPHSSDPNMTTSAIDSLIPTHPNNPNHSILNIPTNHHRDVHPYPLPAPTNAIALHLARSQSPPRSPPQSTRMISANTLRSQSAQTRAIINSLYDTFRDSSGQTQLCVLLLWSGAFLIFISLPKGMIIGFILMSIGTLGAYNLLMERYQTFTREQGLISYLPDGILRDFLLNGSIVDIFYEIRHERLGIPDFILSQLFPMDEADRQLIFEKLPSITRDVATTEGLLYLAPRTVQRFVLPERLRRDRSESVESLRSTDFSDVSPLGISPDLNAVTAIDDGYASDDETDDDVRALRMDQMNRMDLDPEHEDEDGLSPLSPQRPRTVTFVESLNRRERVPDDRILQSNPNGMNSDDNGLEAVDQDPAGHQPASLDVSGSTSSLSSSSSSSSSASSSSDLDPEEETWIESVGHLFRNSIIRRSSGIRSKPVLKAVVDTRIKEIALSVIRTVWKSPFSELTDGQLAAIFCCSVLVLLRWLGRSKGMRKRAVYGMKWMALMSVVAVGVMCFVELNIRRQSKWIKKVTECIEKWLFHSEHHKAVQKRRRQSEQESMGVFTSTSPAAERRRDHRRGSALRAISEEDRASGFSRTLPNLGLWDRMKLKELRDARNLRLSQSELRRPGPINDPNGALLSRSSRRNSLPRIDSNDSLKRYKSAFL